MLETQTNPVAAAVGNDPVKQAGQIVIDAAEKPAEIEIGRRIIPISRGESPAVPPPLLPERPAYMEQVTAAGQAFNASLNEQVKERQTREQIDQTRQVLTAAAADLPAAPVEVASQPVVHDLPAVPAQPELADAIQDARRAALGITVPTRLEKRPVYDLNRPVGGSDSLVGASQPVIETTLPAHEIPVSHTPTVLGRTYELVSPTAVTESVVDEPAVVSVTTPPERTPAASRVETKQTQLHELYDAIDGIRSVDRTADGQYIYGQPLFRAKLEGREFNVYRLDAAGNEQKPRLDEEQFRAVLKEVGEVSKKDLRPLMVLRPELFEQTTESALQAAERPKQPEADNRESPSFTEEIQPVAELGERSDIARTATAEIDSYGNERREQWEATANRLIAQAAAQTVGNPQEGRLLIDGIRSALEVSRAELAVEQQASRVEILADDEVAVRAVRQLALEPKTSTIEQLLRKGSELTSRAFGWLGRLAKRSIEQRTEAT